MFQTTVLGMDDTTDMQALVGADWYGYRCQMNASTKLGCRALLMSKMHSVVGAVVSPVVTWTDIVLTTS